MSNKIDTLGATAVITHRVKDEHRIEYEIWLNEIGPVCKTFPGHLDLQIVRPISTLTATYTIIIRFNSQDNLEAWMYSKERRQLIENVRPLLVKDDDFFIRSGLDFWFTPEGAKAKIPIRWKQFMVTWSAIYPLVLGVPLIVLPVLRQLRLPQDRYLDALCVSGVIVFLMVFLIMPRYTRMIQHWLFR